MISALIEYCIRNRFIVILLTAAVAVLGVWCVTKTPVDAIPDLSENQVIVFADWMGRSPQEIDDQVTYPLSVSLQGLAGIKSIRAESMFGFSTISLIFDDSTDFYFARTRVQEKLGEIGDTLPVRPYMAPDATALGQIFWYTVEGDDKSPDDLRAIQDFRVRYALKSVEGVADVAGVGGFVREYQIDVDPVKLRAFNLSLGAVFDAVARSNVAAGDKVYLDAGAEFLIRGVGWLRSIRDIEKVVVADRGGVPIYVSSVAKVQLGPEFRRSMLEKKGHEAVGGVVLMRYGENPLAVTRAVKQKIEQLQPSLDAEGVRIVPFYDRTRLIEGAVDTLAGTLREELIIAAVAILLILMHFRSAFVVCITLPLAVLIAFILMYFLKIPSNIMSLSGIAISIGILIDAAVVMVENATHELTRHFGEGKIAGDTTEIVIRACRLVGKPIFFAVLIMLVSFLPVFALTGQEGKMFRPLAFTKTFAMVGVAILAVTFVPAIIPIFIKGRLRREEDNWIVRSFINIYKPVLSWLVKVPGVSVWILAALLIVGLSLAGVLGPGAGPGALAILGVCLAFGVIFFRRWWSKGLGLALLIVIALVIWNPPAWTHLRKPGREFMPPLDEGSILDMPVTVPRVGIAQATDDIKVRDQIIGSFPEVDQVVGKVGRADTPTDPSGLDMVETIITLRPKPWWPKRKLKYEDVQRESDHLAAVFAERGWLKSADQTLRSAAAMDGSAAYDRAQRELALRRQNEYAPVLAKKLVVATVNDLLELFREKGVLRRTPTQGQIETLVEPPDGTPGLVNAHGLLLVEVPRREEMNKLAVATTDALVKLGVVDASPDLLLPKSSPISAVRNVVVTAFGGEKPSVVGDLFERFEKRLDEGWRDRVRLLNYELEDQAGGIIVWSLLDGLRSHGQALGLLAHQPTDEELRALVEPEAAAFMKSAFLWNSDKAGLEKELDSELQMPGWGNIWTQPIINRVDMLATGVRTMIGVKVFGPRQEDVVEQVKDATGRPVVENGVAKTIVTQKGIQTVSNEIAAALRNVSGAADVFPDQITGRSYLQIDIDRDKAARYGVSMSNIQSAIEKGMGGSTITTTVEGRQRFAVRLRYARDFWQTREAIQNTLVEGQREGGDSAASPGTAVPGRSEGMTDQSADAAMLKSPMLIPISEVADIHVIEGPSTIKSENGVLRAYVQLNVRDRDIVGFVEEAQRVVAEKVKLPAGFYIEWSGQFEHQVHARNTLLVVVPAVFLLIFVILYLTFKDWRDALVVIVAVLGAAAGGIIFLGAFGFDISVAVMVGFIACAGMAAQTGIVMLVYLHEAIRSRGGLEAIGTEAELTAAVIIGAVHRLRPKLMTEGVAIIGLMPMLWAHGVGAEVIRPMAAPVLGGLLVADEVIDLLIPVVFNWYQLRRWRRIHRDNTVAPLQVI